MEFNAAQQYRPSPNRQNSTARPSSRESTQMLYPYGALALQQPQQQQQHLPQVSHRQQKPSPPYSAWIVPQTHPSYAHLQNGPAMTTRNDFGHITGRSDGVACSSPATSSAKYSNSIGVDPVGSAAVTDYFPGIIDTSPWGQKVCEELESFPSLDPDMGEFDQGLMSHDENTPIIDLRQYHGDMERQRTDNLPNFNTSSARRLSESSFSMSSTGGPLPDVSTYETMASTETIAYGSDYDPWSALEPTSNLLSPLPSPRRPQHDNVVRSGSNRNRASPAPHNNLRSSPYTMESSRFKRWSTGHAPTSTPTSSRPLSQVQDRFAPYPPRINPHHSMPAYPPSAMSNFGLHALHSNTGLYQPYPLQSSDSAVFASPNQLFHLEIPRPLPSQGLFRLLQSNADRHGGCASHFADLSDPPDLYSSLHEEPCDPPESDMNPSDPDLVPHEQDLRFVGDLYTPRWVRGHGNKREGWCGLCKPGRWLVLKNSAFWYDKSFTHGVSAATGAAFQGPQDTRRTEGNLDVWEGLCGSCGDWIALVSNKKKGTTWFRHAYKCHTHPKVKDGPKRRRETSHTVRARAASSASAASSSYPIKKDSSPHDTTNSTPTASTAPASSYSHSTPTPAASTPTRPALQYVGMPSLPLPASSQSTAMFPIASEPSTEAGQTMHHDTSSHASVKQEPVVGMFSSPLQPMSTFSGSAMSNPAMNISEPELVGVKTSPSFNSLANMI